MLFHFQLFQIVQMLVAPVPIIKAIIPENQHFENLHIKHQILLLILEMIRSLKLYMTQLKIWFLPEQYQQFKSMITNYVNKNFPSVSLVLKDWDRPSEGEKDFSNLEFVETIFDIIESYKDISAALLDCLHDETIDLKDVLTKLQQLGDVDTMSKIQINCINIFIDLDCSKFTPHNEIFCFVVPLLMTFYYKDKDILAKNVLRKLLKNTGIFDSCEYEINIWINGILDLKHFDENLLHNFVEILKITYINLPIFIDQLSKIVPSQGQSLAYCEIIKNLEDIEVMECNNLIVKHRHLSPMILGLQQFLNENPCIKSLKIYTNFVLINLVHAQTEIEVILDLIDRFNDVPNSFKSYVLGWQNCQEISTLKKTKGRLSVFENVSAQFFEENIDDFLQNLFVDAYSELPLNLLDCGIFYINNLLKTDKLTITIVDNFLKFLNYLVNNNLINEEIIDHLFVNPTFLQQISFLWYEKENSLGFVIELLVKAVETFKKAEINVNKYLNLYKEKLVENIFKILQKPHKYNSKSFLNVLEVFELNYQECLRILKGLSTLFESYNDFSEIVFGILIYSLREFVKICENDLSMEPLPQEIIKNLTNYHCNLSKNNKNYVSNLSSIFCEYLRIYPHTVEHINEELFNSLLILDEYNKDNVSLIIFLLSQDSKYIENVKLNLELISSKKGVLLPILSVLNKKQIDESLLKDIYKKVEGFLMKALEKPQKAGQQFQQNYDGLCILVNKYMPLETCEKFVAKIQKYEVTEVFHVKLLSNIYKIILNQTNLNSKVINNIILTLIHLQINILKKWQGTNETVNKTTQTSETFDCILEKIQNVSSTIDLSNTCNNEALKLYCKLCLKYGISGNHFLLKSLKNLLKVLIKNLKKEEGHLILEMLLSHSEFLPNVLGEHNDVKFELWSIFSILVENWNVFMERNHVPVLLASYQAMVNKCDKVILQLLKM